MFRLYRVAFRAGHEALSGIIRTPYDMTLHFGDRRGEASLSYIITPKSPFFRVKRSSIRMAFVPAQKPPGKVRTQPKMF